MNKQKGLGLLNLIVVIAMVGVIGLLGSKIGIGYLNQKELKNAVDIGLAESKGLDSTTTKSLKYNIIKALSTSSIDIPAEDIVVTKDDTGFEVSVAYVHEVQIGENVKIVVDLGFVKN